MKPVEIKLSKEINSKQIIYVINTISHYKLFT